MQDTTFAQGWHVAVVRSHALHAHQWEQIRRTLMVAICSATTSNSLDSDVESFLWILVQKSVSGVSLGWLLQDARTRDRNRKNVIFCFPFKY